MPVAAILSEANSPRCGFGCFGVFCFYFFVKLFCRAEKTIESLELLNGLYMARALSATQATSVPDKARERGQTCLTECEERDGSKPEDDHASGFGDSGEPEVRSKKRIGPILGDCSGKDSVIISAVGH